MAQAQAAMNQVPVDLNNTIIRSPVDGIVISRNVDVGQTVAASLQAPTLFTIANDLAKMEVHTNVDEADVGNVWEGQEVTFTVDAFPARRFRGKVHQVRNAPINRPKRRDLQRCGAHRQQGVAAETRHDRQRAVSREPRKKTS